MLTQRLWTRTLLLLRMRTSTALDAAEDPREVMAYAYDQQLELVRRVRQGLVEVATARRQLEQQAERLRARIQHLETQARRALDAEREDLARLALQRKHGLLGEVEGIERQLADVTEEERKLTQAEQQLSARVEEFRARRNVVSARYAAADAQVRAKEALVGVSDEFAELGLAVGRAEERVERLQARAAAIDVLVASEALGVLGGAGVAGGDDAVERELRAVASAKAVEDELAAMKAQAQEAAPAANEQPEAGPDPPHLP
jgi:phage shock protein A